MSCLGHGEKVAQASGQILHRVGDGSEHAAAFGHQIGGAGKRTVGVGLVQRHQIGGLERDAALPVGAQFAEDRPTDPVLRRERIEMGPDGTGAVGIGAAERELRSPAHILRRPAGAAILAHRRQGAHESAVGIGCAAPDMALVQMGVHVGEGGHRHRSGHIDRRAAALDDEAVGDGEVHAQQIARLPQQAGGHGQVGQAQRPVRQRLEIHHASRFNALSCHLRSRRCETSDSAAKMKTPIAATSDRAANMRAMFSR